MEPTIGRIVIYNTTKSQQRAIEAANRFNGLLNCNVQKQLPAMIVAVWGPECVNLKVTNDGNVADLWVTSATCGNQPGQWEWPVIKK